MTPRGASRRAWSLWASTVLLVAAGLTLAVVYRHDAPIYEFWRESALISLTFATVGALIASRRPANRIGWILCVGSVCGGLQLLAGQYATISIVGADPGLSAARVAAWLSGVMQISAVVAMLSLLLLFPTGASLPGRWRGATRVAVGCAAIAVLGTAVAPGRLDSPPFAVNPFGIEALSGVAEAGSAVAAVVLVSLSVVSLIARFVRSRGEERQQLKWFVYAGSVGIVVIVFGGEGPLGNLVWTLVPLSLPVAIGVAILKHRLYDIDVIINRTLVYGALTGFLALTYLALVYAFQQLFRPVAGESGIAVAASTLAVAALFRPARARIQAFIDRRFYRSKYDAAQTLETFSRRLRDEVDLEALSRELVGIVQETMHPAHVSLWLRGARR